MAKTVKCQQCGVSDTLKEEMEFELTTATKPVKKYYHKGDCWKIHLKDKAFKDNERIELDELVEVIKSIYGVKVIPNKAYPSLQEIRIGARKGYKKGYSYSLMAETFLYCSESIEFANATKNFNGFVNALRYGLAIVCDKLMIVENRRVLRAKQEAMITKHIEEISGEEQDFVSGYKKKEKSKSDITDFLDD